MIKYGGKVFVDDVHTSFIKHNWYNPSKYSFINYSKQIIEDINSRFPDLKTFHCSLRKFIYKIEFFESIVSFDINRKLCKKNIFIDNKKTTINPIEFRNSLNKNSIFYKIKNFFKLRSNFTYLVFTVNAFKLKKYFK